MVGVLAWGCRSALPPSGMVRPGTFVGRMSDRVSLIRRSYRVHVPEGYDAERRWPVIVVLHGAFSSARGIEKVTGFSELADREGLIVVYPNGIGLFGLFRHWNAGICCAKAMKDGIDDVDFVFRVVDDAASRLRFDASRVYLVGNSNGGMLAYRIAAERPERVVAIAVSGGTVGAAPAEGDALRLLPEPRRPLPVMIFHGRADESIPYEAVVAGAKGGQVVPLLNSAAFWVRHNRCAPEPERDALRADRVERQRWKGTEGGAELVLYSLEGWGHDWPGRHFTERLPADDPLRGFDAAEIIWDFFRQHDLAR